MKLITYENFKRLLNGPKGKYYEGRWEYFSKVIEIIKEESITSVLELGPALETIIKGSHVK